MAIITVDNLSAKQVQNSLHAEWKGRRVEPKKTTAKNTPLLSLIDSLSGEFYPGAGLDRSQIHECGNWD
jgi:hypothetical protein